ncbi:hypothetical protein OMP38_07395 [Cohnella ginsengisoli]|uniref:Penicillin-binding protein dimerisation domain-containing protein n=1 Tax=Cohnella ginsengisoli TaxID=425004 RepID=A0A9X4QLE8_9BACL|nr:hypothetical protein [Cohnella ginsengisoli]MDG0790699.1 hypothetical protein [Cohnella ginsengisoli]
MSDKLTEEAERRVLRNRRHFSIRLNFFFFTVFGLFSVLIIRLAYLQFVEGPNLKEQEHQLATKDVSIPPIRGNIYDSAGFPIAYSTSTQSLYFTLEPGTKKGRRTGAGRAHRGGIQALRRQDEGAAHGGRDLRGHGLRGKGALPVPAASDQVGADGSGDRLFQRAPRRI